MKERTQYLIAYFAVKGKEETAMTAKVAAKLGNKLTEKGMGFDTFAIVPVETYPENNANLEIATKSEKNLHSRPELIGKYSGMKEVKDILLVVPNWWNSLPMGVFSFFDDYDFSGKKIVPVVIHSGDGAAQIATELRNSLKNVWILPPVEIKDTEEGNCGAQLEKAINELLEEQK